jgi:hypothetical protein
VGWMFENHVRVELGGGMRTGVTNSKDFLAKNVDPPSHERVYDPDANERCCVVD